jgi:serine/threonine-protein kinase
MGVVYEVTDRETGRRRALKTMLRGLVLDSEMRARFRLEITAAARIESDHIVDVFDAGIDQSSGFPFLVMELLRGETVGAMVEQTGHLGSHEAVFLLGQARLALDRAHAAGIVHRDLKPDNLFVTRADDGTPRLKVLDFGIAKVIAEGTHAPTTRSLGTPLYMSPEQIRGDGGIDSRADLYSLAHVAFTMLAGAPYWQTESKTGTPYALLLKVAAGASEPATARASRLGVTLPPAFDAWFCRATASDASERFDTASELVEGLAAALDIDLPGPAQVESELGSPRRRDRADPVSGNAGAPPRVIVDSTAAAAATPKTAARSKPRTFLLIGGLSSVGVFAAIGFALGHGARPNVEDRQNGVAPAAAASESGGPAPNSIDPEAEPFDAAVARLPPLGNEPRPAPRRSSTAGAAPTGSRRSPSTANLPSAPYDPTDIR